MSTMDFFGDFCLSCDQQTNGTTFCSQACRLAELDQYTSSQPTSPIYYDSANTLRTSSDSVTSGFYLPPAFDFSIYRVPSSHSLSTNSTTSYTSSSSSSSRNRSSKISEQARNDLRDYVGSFDQTRTLRRRISMQSNEDVRHTARR